MRGSQRDQLIEPCMRINKLFTPKMVKLEESHYQFLDWVEEGQIILEDIENEYNYEIYFAFDKSSRSIKLFCEDRKEKEIVTKLKERIKSYKNHS